MDSTSKKTFRTGEVIMRQGDAGGSAYIIESGRVEIRIRQGDGRDQTVGTRGPGTMIGEMSLVDHAPRTATIVALEDCALLEITADEFSRRLDGADPVVRMTTQVILNRYRDTLMRAEIRGYHANWTPAEAAELDYAEESDALETIKLANDFKAALKNGELFLHYQPIIELQTGHIAGFEALMRWTHPERGPISPALFIPVAEKSNLIVQASQWALRESCSALKRMETRLHREGDLFMSVNFSSTDFAETNFVDTVYDTISATDLRPEQVHLEITERLLMGQPENAKQTLLMCRKAGMSISIDDFGTGYSSLSYLHYFPIDTLKIDRSFVSDMHKDEGSMELIKSIIGLGKNMKMKIIAEGVENKEEAETLKRLGCDQAQGYYFAKPMSETDALHYLQNAPRQRATLGQAS